MSQKTDIFEQLAKDVMRNAPNALEDCDRAIALYPNEPEPLALRAFLAQKKKDFKFAIEILKKSVLISKYEDQYVWKLSWLMTKNEQYIESIELISNFIKLKKDIVSPFKNDIIFNYCFCLLKCKNYQEFDKFIISVNDDCAVWISKLITKSDLLCERRSL